MPEPKSFFDRPDIRLQILQVHGGAVLALVDWTIIIVRAEEKEAEAMRMLRFGADFADAKEKEGDLSEANRIREELRRIHLEIGEERRKLRDLSSR